MELSFGDFRVHPTQGLWQRERELHVTPKSLAVLHLLASRGGAVVSKDELVAAVWPGVAISDSAVTTCIKELRRALDDDARQPRYIETLHRRGFRFLAPVGGRGAAQPGDAPAGAAETRLVGREAPLARLAGAAARAHDGERQVVVVVGEAGIGKTALVHGLLRDTARRHGWRVTHGQCVEHYGEAEPYQPLLDAVVRLCRGADADRFIEPLRRCAPSWLAQLPSLQPPAEHALLQQRTAGVTATRMRRELVDALEAMAAHQPIALWLEDLHWSDVATLDWIADFAARRDPARLLLVATSRSGDFGAEPHPTRALIEMLHVKHWSDEIVLSGLGEAEVAALVAARFPAAGESVDRLGRLLHRHTGGNPLFVMTVLGDLAARGMLAPHDGGWRIDPALDAASLGVPDDVRRTITRQIDRLNAVERAGLEAMSVLGGACPAAAVAAGAGASVADIEAALAALAGERWLIVDRGRVEWPDGTQSEAFEFVHALYRDVVAARLPPTRRADLHQRVGERLERAYGARADEIAAELAMHFDDAGDRRRAVTYLVAAAETSRRRSAFSVAESQLRRALALVDRLPHTPERLRQEIDIRLALGSLLMAVRGWGSDEIDAHYTRALALSRQLDAAEPLFPSLWGLWLFQWGRGDARRARDLAAELHALVEADTDSARQLQAHHAGWATAFSLGQFDEARRQATDGMAIYDVARHAALASAYGSHDAGTCALNFLARALVVLGRVDEAVQQSDAALTLAHDLAHPFTLAQALVFAAGVHHARQDPDRTHRCASAALRIADEHGFRLMAAWASIFEGWTLLRTGRIPEGLAMVDESLRASAVGSGQFMTQFFGILGEASLAAVRPDQGLRAVDEGLRLVDHTGERFYEGELHRLRGELRIASGASGSEAEEDFRRACAIARAQNARWLLLRAATSLAAVSGDRRESADLIARTLDGIGEVPGLPDVVAARDVLRTSGPTDPPRRSKPAARPHGRT